MNGASKSCKFHIPTNSNGSYNRAIINCKSYVALNVCLKLKHMLQTGATLNAFSIAWKRLSGSLPSIHDTVTHRQNGDNKIKLVLNLRIAVQHSTERIFDGRQRTSSLCPPLLHVTWYKLTALGSVLPAKGVACR